MGKAYWNKYIILFFISLSLNYPLDLVAQDSHLHLYIPNKDSKLDEIVSIIEKANFELSYPQYADNDTLVIYQKDNQTIHVAYCSISKKVFNYKCEWCFDPSITDEFSISNRTNADTYYNLSKRYFFNVLDSLNHRYGKPRYIYSHKGYGYTILNKNNLDTLNYDNLFNNHCFFEIFWVNTGIRVILGFDNTADYSLIKYSYYDFDNHKLKNEELTTIFEKDKMKGIALWVIIGLIIAFALFFIIKRINESRKEKAEERRQWEAENKRKLQIREKEKREKQERAEEQLRQLEIDHKVFVSSLAEKYGDCDKTISLNQQTPHSFDEILVFSQSKHVVIAKKDYSFSDILDCIVNDEIKERETVQTFRGDSSATSKTNTGSMIGRTIAGGVLLGGAGAIIGGSTAKRNTVIEYGTDTSIHNKEIEHNYTVAITVKDISNPVININVGSDTALKDEIVGLMKVIISLK